MRPNWQPNIGSNWRSNFGDAGGIPAEPPDPRFTVRPTITGTPAIGELLTVTDTGTAVGTEPIDITGEWYIGSTPTGVTITVIEVTTPGTYRWRSTATNSEGVAHRFSNNIFVTLAADPDNFGLPQVFLTVADPGAINATTKTQATIVIVNAFGSTLSDDERLVDDQYVDLKWAGNSTLEADKKAYNMTTLTAPSGSNNDVPLLGMATGRDWRLLANAYDLTDLKTYFCLGIGDELDLPWTPHGRNCEVFLNGVYQGTYFLAERVKRHANRINIGSAASGAFLCEIVADVQADLDAVLFTTPLMHAPGDPNGSGNPAPVSFAMEYGTLATADAAVNAFETALVARDWATVWIQMDMPSAVDWFLFYDTIANIDGPRFGSARICRDNPSGIKGGKFFFVPWDFDLTADFPFDDPEVTPFAEVDTNRYVTNRWFGIIIEDPAFVAAVIARKEAYSAIFNSWLTRFIGKAAFLDSTGSRTRNFTLNGSVTFDIYPYLHGSPGEATDVAHDFWVDRLALIEADDYVPDVVTDEYGLLILSRNPIGWWRLNETSGTVANDSSGNGNHGTYQSGVTLGQSGPGSDYAMDVGTGYMDMSTFSIPGSTPHTLEFWANCTTRASVSGSCASVGTGASTHCAVYAPFLDNVYYADDGGETGDNRINGSDSGFSDGTWHQVVLVADNGLMELWLDGVLYASNATHVLSASAFTELRVGMHFGGGGFKYPGKIADVTVYAAALTEAQINENRDTRLGL